MRNLDGLNAARDEIHATMQRFVLSPANFELSIIAENLSSATEAVRAEVHAKDELIRELMHALRVQTKFGANMAGCSVMDATTNATRRALAKVLPYCDKTPNA